MVRDILVLFSNLRLIDSFRRKLAASNRHDASVLFDAKTLHKLSYYEVELGNIS